MQCNYGVISKTQSRPGSSTARIEILTVHSFLTNINDYNYSKSYKIMCPSYCLQNFFTWKLAEQHIRDNALCPVQDALQATCKNLMSSGIGQSEAVYRTRVEFWICCCELEVHFHNTHTYKMKVSASMTVHAYRSSESECLQNRLSRCL